MSKPGKLSLEITDPETEWIEYLRRLPDSGAIGPAVAAQAQALWRQIREVEPGLALPEAVATDAGGLYIGWDDGPHHLEIEILATGQYEWFYRNRTTGIVQGEDDRAGTALTPGLLARVRELAGATRP
jgi:hypothetical protein